MANLQGVFGGTFDPVHFGHVGGLTETINRCRLSRVYVLPAAHPPHRESPGAGAAHRLEMTRLAFGHDERFILDTRELERTGPSYTVDSVEALLNENPRTPFALIVGLDAVLNLPAWHRWETLLSFVDVLVMHRSGACEMPAALAECCKSRAARSVSELGGEEKKILHVPISPIAISATDIRRRLQSGKSIRDLVPESVLSYISEHQLYSA